MIVGMISLGRMTTMAMMLISFWLGMLSSFVCKAHSMILSEYTLQYDQGEWVLSMEQRTRQMRDAVYAANPELRGINLNSEAFKEATARLIRAHITLAHQRKPDQRKALELEPLYMHFDGLQFEAGFILAGMPENPNFLVIETNGYDEHEHSVVLLRVAMREEAYVHYFHKDSRHASFDFAAHRYYVAAWQPPTSHSWFFCFLLSIIATAVVVGIYRWLKPVKRATV